MLSMERRRRLVTVNRARLFALRLAVIVFASAFTVSATLSTPTDCVESGNDSRLLYYTRHYFDAVNAPLLRQRETARLFGKDTSLATIPGSPLSEFNP